MRRWPLDRITNLAKAATKSASRGVLVAGLLLVASPARAVLIDEFDGRLLVFPGSAGPLSETAEGAIGGVREVRTTHIGDDIAEARITDGVLNLRMVRRTGTPLHDRDQFFTDLTYAGAIGL